MSLTVGVLALQGAFREHLEFFREIVNCDPDRYGPYSLNFIEVRTAEELARCGALVIPGGESTTMSLVAERTHLLQPLLDYVASHEHPVWGTCAGLIMMARHLRNGKPNQHTLGGLDIEVTRNAFGRQLSSFEAPLDFSSFIPGCDAFPTVFIRAPVVSKILDPVEATEMPIDGGVTPSKNKHQRVDPVEVLHTLKDYHGVGNDLIVAVRQGKNLGTSFHPELLDDKRFHKWFLDLFVLRDR